MNPRVQHANPTAWQRPEPPDGDAAATQDRVRAIAQEFAADRGRRQHRRELDPHDFARLAEAGFLLSSVPCEMGGLWRDIPQSTRFAAELLRAIASADSSVALVCAMHPSVLAFWLGTPTVPASHREAWLDQRKAIFQSALGGAWWGTITSEAGSGGDISRTRAIATPDAGGTGYLLSGDKQFGSGSGISAYMMTTAIPVGEDRPDLFYLPVQDTASDGSSGMRLVAPWDGHGMIATQSHAFHFDGYPAMRAAWPGHLDHLADAAKSHILCCFAGVFVGIVDAAVLAARAHFGKRQHPLLPFEQVEWARAELDSWLLQQAYAGMLHAVETQQDAAKATLQGKLAITELAETVLTRICRIVGGGAYARTSPFGFWAQDVRALGFLRPPWALGFDALVPKPPRDA